MIQAILTITLPVFAAGAGLILLAGRKMEAPARRRLLLKNANYLLVVLEIGLLPLAFDAWPLAVIFSIANALLLIWRIHVEETALTPRRPRSMV